MSRQKKVLLIENSTGVGGSTISLFRLVGRLMQGPFQPLVLFYRDNDYTTRFTALGVETSVMMNGRHEAGQGVTVPVHRSGRGGRLPALGRELRQFAFRDMLDALRIYQAIRMRNVDLVHINGRFNSTRGAILAARLARVPCLFHVRDFYSFGPLDRWYANRVDLFLYISRAVRSYTEHFLPKAKGLLVYDGVNQAEFQRCTDAAEERKKYGLEARDLVVGNIGRLVEWKGQHVFLEAVSQVANEFPRLRAVIAGETDPPGDTSYLEALKNLTRELGLEEKVIFTGFVADVPRVIAIFDVLVHSSIKPEPFGLTILEGMAAGLPVVATAAGGALDLVQDKETGRLVPSGDAHSMAEALRYILSQKEDAARMGEAARKHIAEKFTIEQFAKTVELAYSRILS